jgi:hypothetical protein
MHDLSHTTQEAGEAFLHADDRGADKWEEALFFQLEESLFLVD